MYHNRSPHDLYQEYEARVDRAVRNYERAATMQPVERTRWPALPSIGAWLTTIRRRLERRLQPTDEGYIA